MTLVLTGRCECGAVEYRVADEFLYSLNCHCSNCRAHTGSAFKPSREAGRFDITDDLPQCEELR